MGGVVVVVHAPDVQALLDSPPNYGSCTLN